MKRILLARVDNQVAMRGAFRLAALLLVNGASPVEAASAAAAWLVEIYRPKNADDYQRKLEASFAEWFKENPIGIEDVRGIRSPR
jgi:hypothetical protein